MNFEYIKKNYKPFILATVFSVVFFGALAFRYLTPFGATVKYQFTSDKDGAKISPLNGVENSEQLVTNSKSILSIPKQIIRKDIVTFNLTLLSKDIKGVWVKLVFAGNPKEIKLGMRGDTTQKYTYKPLYQILLNQLDSLKGFVFWQKEGKFKSFDEFAANVPNDKLIGTYYYDPGALAVSAKNTQAIPDPPFSVSTALRGSHTFYVRVDKQPFQFSVFKQDMNAYAGDDMLVMELYKQDKLIAEQQIADDGVSDAGRLSMLPQKGMFDIPDLEKGIYRIELKDKSKGGDLKITQIESNQTKVVIANNLFIIDPNPVKVYTTVKDINIIPVHATSLQTVKLDERIDLAIKNPQQPHKFNLDKPVSYVANPNKNASASAKWIAQTTDNVRELHTLEFPKNDLSLKGKGYYAFTPNSMFDPSALQTVDVTTLKSLDAVDFILANYTKAKKTGDYYEASVYFDPKMFEIKGDKLYFSLESPGLEKAGGQIDLQNLEVTVEKPAWADTK